MEKRKKDEVELILAKQAMTAVTNGIMITDTQGMIQWVNPAFTKLTGYTFKEVLGKSTNILYSGKQDQAFYKRLWDTILGGKVWHGEIINRKKDGSLYTEEQTITPVRDNKGELINFIAIKQGVSIRKKLEKELLLQNAELVRLNKSQEESRSAMLNVMEDLERARNIIASEKAKDEAMLASIGDGLIAVDNNRKVIMMNKAAEDILGWDRSELLGKLITNFNLEDKQGTLVPLEKRPPTIAMATGKIINDVYYFVKKDKTRFPLSITATPIKLGEKTIGLIEVLRDVTKESEIDRAKSEFVSLASHQLRTPLGIMKWYLEALENEEYFSKAPITIRQYIDEIYKSNERVLSLVRDLLSVSRIDEGRVKNAPKMVDLIQVVKDVVEQMRIMASKKKVLLHIVIGEGKIPAINIDIIRVHEVIENLIGNAIEYTLPSGTVKVTISKADNNVLIRVEDTGIGISAADQKKLFIKFFRSEKAVAQNPEGSGLGLYVVKSYVEGWGGKISFTSKEGKGSIFTISLPINTNDKSQGS